MLEFARARGLEGAVLGDARALPFRTGAVDHCIAVTSLCFVPEPEQALAEMWRVARRSVALGLLNRHSLLYRRKRASPGYAGARWDTLGRVREWAASLQPPPTRMRHGHAIRLPGGGPGARLLERCLPARVPGGGFLGVVLTKPGVPGA